MGNAQQQQQINPNNAIKSSPNKNQQSIQQQQFFHKEIQPYIPGQRNNTQLQEDSILSQFLEQRNQQNGVSLLQSIQNKPQKQKQKPLNLFEEIAALEETFSPEYQEKIHDFFDMYSMQNKVGKKKCLEYFGLLEQQELNLGHILFQTIKDVYPKNHSGPYLDYSKFLKTISMLSLENEEGRLQFTYSLFDRKQKGHLEKEDVQQMLESIFECLMGVYFEKYEYNELKKSLLKYHERDIGAAMRRIVDDIMNFSVNNQGVINYEGYTQWIKSQHGFSECMEFNPQESHTYYDD